MSNKIIRNFLNKYRSHILHLIIEEYLGWFVRSLPGILGVYLRSFVYKFLLRDLSSLIIIYPGVYLTHTYGISFGKNCSINTGAMIDGRGGVTIGDYVMVCPYVYIASSSHNHSKTKIPMTLLGHKMKPVVIKSDVWIEAHTTISGGVTVGNGVVIGSGAVVTKDVPDYQIVGGITAKKIGFRGT